MEKIHEEVLAAFFVLGRDQSGRSLPSEGSGQKKLNRPDTARGGWEYNQPIRKAKTEIPDERMGLL
jgi:hypothetical protein